MLMSDRHGRIVLVNAETEKLFGYARDELIGASVDRLVPERLRSLHPAHRTGFFVDPTSRPMGAGRDLYALRRDGSEFPVEIGLNPIRTEEDVFVLASIVDISERKRMEARFRATIESAPVAMVMIDRRGHIVLVNAELEKLFGYARNEMLGSPVEVLVPNRSRHAHPNLREGFFAAPEARRMGAGRELMALRKDGSEFPVEIGLNPVVTDEGLFVLGGVVDITERKRLEESQRRLNEELQSRLGELAHSNSALERSNVELQQFAYVASHDLQTPLRGIAGFAQFLERDYRGRLDDTADHYIDRIVASVKRMQTLIGDVLDYSRVDSRARPFEPTDLNEICRDALAILDSSLADSGGEVIVEELPIVRGDRAQLTQLFQNLIGNAIKYHGKAPPKVEVTSEANDGGWVISVRDNGIGIAPKHHERVFEIFRRLHPQDAYPGTGIGLAVCRRIVHRHGGTIWVESEAGAGSVFSFTLPDKARQD
ncbi:MAG: PAS domain S-box protein [Deltaproteobacteria bacterium]|nr:PAS domain S-box protein [Deltaproteobacteria bacterium]